MIDVFYTVLIIWVLWRLLGGTFKTHVFHHHTVNHKKEGDISIQQSSSSAKKPHNTDQGEYVDFEEVK